MRGAYNPGSGVEWEEDKRIRGIVANARIKPSVRVVNVRIRAPVVFVAVEMQNRIHEAE